MKPLCAAALDPDPAIANAGTLKRAGLGLADGDPLKQELGRATAFAALREQAVSPGRPTSLDMLCETERTVGILHHRARVRISLMCLSGLLRWPQHVVLPGGRPSPRFPEDADRVPAQVLDRGGMRGVSGAVSLA